MAIDFSNMLDDDDSAVIDPRDIFFTLERSPNFSFPRDIQTEVMNQWFESRDEPDNVIKLNVGSGKTLVGLLLLQSSLNEGKGPALYVAPDKQLALQVIKEAETLGIDVTDDPRDPAYGACERICVVNVYKLFNGRSVFGVGSSRIDVGTVIVDDAHACVSTITEQFRIKISNNHDAYGKYIQHWVKTLKHIEKRSFWRLPMETLWRIWKCPFGLGPLTYLRSLVRCKKTEVKAISHSHTRFCVMSFLNADVSLVDNFWRLNRRSRQPI